MQEPRRRSRLEQYLLPLSFLFALGCAARPSSTPLAESPPSAPSQSSSPVTANSAPDSELLPASGTNAETHPAEPVGAETASAKTNPPQNPPTAAPDPASYGFPKDTLILHVGDSFAGSLGVPLGKRFKAAGMRTVLEFQTASYVPTWASGKELPSYINKFSPSLVIITLGANEVELTNPEQRAGAVKRLVRKLGGRPCVWVIPPLWKPDTGIFKVIRENVAPCRVLESYELVHDITTQIDNLQS